MAFGGNARGEAHKTVSSVAAPPFPPAARDMTTLGEATWRCAVCGNESRHTIAMSTRAETAKALVVMENREHFLSPEGRSALFQVLLGASWRPYRRRRYQRW